MRALATSRSRPIRAPSSCLVRLTPPGEAEMLRLQQVDSPGLPRSLPTIEVRSLTALLRKLERSKAAGRRPPPGRRWAAAGPPESRQRG